MSVISIFKLLYLLHNFKHNMVDYLNVLLLIIIY